MATHKRVWKKNSKVKEHFHHRGKWRNSSQNHPQQLQQYGIRTSCKATKKTERDSTSTTNAPKRSCCPQPASSESHTRAGKGEWECERDQKWTGSLRIAFAAWKKRGMGMGKMIKREKKYTSTQIHTHNMRGNWKKQPAQYLLRALDSSASFTERPMRESIRKQQDHVKQKKRDSVWTWGTWWTRNVKKKNTVVTVIEWVAH